MSAELTTRDQIAAGLRRWAKGIYPSEAAAELLIRFNHGRLLTTPCVEQIGDDHGDEYAAIYPEGIEEAGYLSGGEYRVLLIAVSLVSPTYRVPLTDVLPGLDRDALALVLATVAHASGSHEHSRMTFDADGIYAGSERLPALYAWPDERTER